MSGFGSPTVNPSYGSFATAAKNIVVKLSAGAIRHQQMLSDKYGIPTFNVDGTLSTIPSDLKFSNIFEGFGAYGNAVDFKQAVVDKVSKNPSAYNVTITNNAQGQQSVTIPDPTQAQRTFNVDDPTKPLIETTGTSGISDFIAKNKMLVFGAGALLGLLVVGGGRR